MFQSLTPGSTVYLLHRDGPEVETCTVETVNTHLPQYDPARPQAVLSGMVTDLSLRTGKGTVPFLTLPAASATANFPDRGLFLTEDRKALTGEISAIRDNSRRIVESVDTHRKTAAKCEELLLALDPEKQRALKAEREMDSLKRELEANRAELSELKSMLAGFLKKAGGHEITI